MSDLIFVAYMLSALLAIISAYLAIQLHGKDASVRIVMALFTFTVIGGVKLATHMAASLTNVSQSYLDLFKPGKQAIKNGEHNLLLEKTLRSCRPLILPAWRAFEITEILALIYIDSVASQTVNLLLSFN